MRLEKCKTTISFFLILCSFVLNACGDPEIQVVAGPELTDVLNKNRLENKEKKKIESVYKRSIVIETKYLRAQLGSFEDRDWFHENKNVETKDAIVIVGSLFDFAHYEELNEKLYPREKPTTRSSTTEEKFLELIPLKEEKSQNISPSTKVFNFQFNPIALGETNPNLHPIFLNVDRFIIQRGEILKTFGRDLIVSAKNISIEGQISTAPETEIDKAGGDGGRVILLGGFIECASQALLSSRGANAGKMTALTFESDLKPDEIRNRTNEILNQNFQYEVRKKYRPLKIVPRIQRPSHQNGQFKEQVTLEDLRILAKALPSIQSKLPGPALRFLSENIDLQSPRFLSLSFSIGTLSEDEVFVRGLEIDSARGVATFRKNTADGYGGFDIPILYDRTGNTIIASAFIEQELQIPVPIHSSIERNAENTPRLLQELTDRTRKNRIPISLKNIEPLPGGNGGHIGIFRGYGSSLCQTNRDTGSSSSEPLTQRSILLPKNMNALSIPLKVSETPIITVWFSDGAINRPDLSKFTVVADLKTSAADENISIPVEFLDGRVEGSALHRNDPLRGAPNAGLAMPNETFPANAEEVLKIAGNLNLKILDARSKETPSPLKVIEVLN